MDEVRYRGVYGYFVDDLLVYVGSSVCGIQVVEHNHRNWKMHYGESGRTNFRTHLTEKESYKSGVFRWLVDPKLRTRLEVETLEGQLIRSLNPPLNLDRDPVASSVKYGRL
jgi:hypothetical protein